MCYYHGYRWYAEVWEQDDNARSRVGVACDECCHVIPAGERHVTIHAEENEFGILGEDGEMDHGESFDYVCCRACWAFRRAVRAVEEAEGCTHESAEPKLCCLWDDAMDSDHADEYVERFRVDAPRVDQAWLKQMTARWGDDE